MKKPALGLVRGERKKIAYVLIAIVLLSIIYPFSEQGTVAALIFVFLYLGLLGSGIYLVSSNRTLLVTAIILTVIIGTTGVTTILTDFWDTAMGAVAVGDESHCLSRLDHCHPGYLHYRITFGYG